MKKHPLILLLPIWFACNSQKDMPDITEYTRVKKSISIADVWSGHPVSFDVLTTNDAQFVAYYNTGRVMCVARRSLQGEVWETTRLPSKVGWDSHNSIVLAVDGDGFLHVSGNMHVNPLVYFRSSKPNNIETFEQHSMVGRDEERVTYPVFFKNDIGELYFQYREGSSGDGITYINKYDVESKMWTRILDHGLFDGEGETNAYPSQPIKGPDGYFHYLWVWRLNPIANTNHNLSYMRTADFKNFENISGEKIEIPVLYRERRVIADPVGPWNGLMNSSKLLSFDSENNVLIGYHKFDEKGISQLFLARFEKDRWIQRQVSDWPDFTWQINKKGTLKNSIGLHAIKADGHGNIYIAYSHEKYGSGLLCVDESALILKEDIPNKRLLEISGLPNDLNPNMQYNTQPDNTGNFVLRWQTLPVNFDRPRSPPYPAPTALILYELE